MREAFDVIVVGIGAMGSAACHHLAGRGLRVLGLEQFDIPHNLGSSHGHSRMIRLAYYEHPDYVPLLRRAYELWEELEKISGQKLLHITGGLYMGEPSGELVSQSSRAAKVHGVAHEMLSAAQIMARYPQFQMDSNQAGLYEPRAGFLLPEKVIAAYARSALEHGAEIHGREAVREWSADGSGVRVRTDRGEYRAEKLVVTAGPWTDKLLHDLGAKLVVTRQVLSWFWPKDPATFQLGQMPVWAVERPAGGLFYGFPMSDEDLGLKLALHWPREAVDPDRVARDPQPGDLDEVREFVSRCLPRAVGPLLSQRICMYTNSPDFHFIIDRHPKHPQVAVACGFSGHGFKFASVVGEILADLVTQGKTSLPAQFLGLSRFAKLGQAT